MDNPRHKVSSYVKLKFWDFPGGPVVKTLPFHFRRHRFDRWWGTEIPQSMPHAPQPLPKKKKKETPNQPTKQQKNLMTKEHSTALNTYIWSFSMCERNKIILGACGEQNFPLSLSWLCLHFVGKKD